MQPTETKKAPETTGIVVRLRHYLDDRDVHVDVADLAPGSSLRLRVSRTQEPGGLALSISRDAGADERKPERETRAAAESPTSAAAGVVSAAKAEEKTEGDPSPSLEGYFSDVLTFNNVWHHELSGWSPEPGMAFLTGAPSLSCPNAKSTWESVWLTSTPRVIVKSRDPARALVPEGCDRLAVRLVSMNARASARFLRFLLIDAAFRLDKDTVTHCVALLEAYGKLAWPTAWGGPVAALLPKAGQFRARYAAELCDSDQGCAVLLNCTDDRYDDDDLSDAASRAVRRVELLRYPPDHPGPQRYALRRGSASRTLYVSQREMLELCRRIASEATLDLNTTLALCRFALP